MNQTTMQRARESFLKKHYFDESSLKVLNDAEDLSSLLIEVEACDSIERGVFLYNREKNEFSLLKPDHFFVRRLPCDNISECYKSDVSFDTCLKRYSGEPVQPFERFLKLCIQDIYQLSGITKK